MNIAEFILARLSEVERSAQRGDDSRPWPEPMTAARVRADCVAKRAIVSEHVPDDPCQTENSALAAVPCRTLRALAWTWSDHQDFDPAWVMNAHGEVLKAMRNSPGADRAPRAGA